MFNIKKAMTTDVIIVQEDTTIYDAMKILRDNDITGMPVIAGDMQVIGIVSEKDLIRLMYLTGHPNPLVKEVMTKEVVSFDENDSFIEVAECLINNNFRRVPILSKNKLIGIITRNDIIKSFIKYRMPNE